jgi:hypothetical protein
VRLSGSENPYLSIRSDEGSIGGAVAMEVGYAIKGGSSQIKREGDDADVIFRSKDSWMFRNSYSTQPI